MLPVTTKTTKKAPLQPYHKARNFISISLIVLLLGNLILQANHSSVGCTWTSSGKTQACNGFNPAGRCIASAVIMTESSNNLTMEIDCPWSSRALGVTYLSYLLTLVMCILFLPKVNIRSYTTLMVSGILSSILLVAGCSLMITDIIQGHDYYTKTPLLKYTYTQNWYIISAVVVGLITLVALAQAILAYKLYATQKKGGNNTVASGTARGGVTIGGSNNTNAQERYMRMNQTKLNSTQEVNFHCFMSL
jgi:low affinity Fe/Cu permease